MFSLSGKKKIPPRKIYHPHSHWEEGAISSRYCYLENRRKDLIWGDLAF